MFTCIIESTDLTQSAVTNQLLGSDSSRQPNIRSSRLLVWHDGVGVLVVMEENRLRGSGVRMNLLVICLLNTSPVLGAQGAAAGEMALKWLDSPSEEARVQVAREGRESQATGTMLGRAVATARLP